MKFLRNMGAVWMIQKRIKVCNSFLVIKNKRNQLAHGSISFSACGSNYLLSELKKFKEDIFLT